MAYNKVSERNFECSELKWGSKMEKTAQQSLLDILIQIMPALQDVKTRLVNRTDPANEALFSIWDGSDKTASRKFLKPSNIKSSDLKKMEAAGLVEDQGKYLKITEKGAQSIRVMILNDNTFALDKKSSNNKSLGWYERLKNENYLS